MKKLLIVVSVVLAACGGSDTADTTADVPTPTTASTTAGTTADNSTTAAPATEETPPPTTAAPTPSSGPPGIVLTIGDETWEFDRALCAYIGATPGQAGSEWNVSSVKDGAQVYISEDSFGPLVEYDDISNGGNPNFSWESTDAITLSVDGNDITGTGEFTDSVSGTGPLAGTVTATCTDWAEG